MILGALSINLYFVDQQLQVFYIYDSSNLLMSIDEYESMTTNDLHAIDSTRSKQGPRCWPQSNLALVIPNSLK